MTGRFEEIQKNKLRDRWRKLATDLEALVKGGTLDNEMSLKEAIKCLSELEPE